jgi:D-alanyl-lipoteichoic acid acyltransferase DltB (MBOAT superfamily)
MIAVDYIAGIVIEQASGWRRKFFLGLSLVANIGVLGVFKYGGFLAVNTDLLLGALHIPARLPLWNILLPVGLSFHTFQAMSYTIEVYRGNQAAEKHLGIYALYVMFYPQMVAGPIERPGRLLHQFREEHVFKWGNLTTGARLMLWGFFKKLVIADRLSEYVNYVYDNADHLSSVYIAVAVLFFSFQIYCDFSGYSDIAVGAARVMGYDLMVNFRRPYFARNIQEFWTRWHISLSTWFRDYMYIPLGGSRVGRGRKYANILIVFLLSGFWHGAGWNFIIWGGVNALIMICWMYYQERFGRGITHGRVWKTLSVLFTFGLVTITWVFFRCKDTEQAMNILAHLFGRVRDTDFDFLIPKTTVALGFFFIGVLLLLEKYTSPGIEELQGRFWPDIAFGSLMLGAILLFGVFSGQSFIYFQF